MTRTDYDDRIEFFPADGFVSISGDLPGIDVPRMGEMSDITSPSMFKGGTFRKKLSIPEQSALFSPGYQVPAIGDFLISPLVNAIPSIQTVIGRLKSGGNVP